MIRYALVLLSFLPLKAFAQNSCAAVEPMKDQCTSILRSASSSSPTASTDSLAGSAAALAQGATAQSGQLDKAVNDCLAIMRKCEATCSPTGEAPWTKKSLPGNKTQYTDGTMCFDHTSGGPTPTQMANATEDPPPTPCWDAVKPMLTQARAGSLDLSVATSKSLDSLSGAMGGDSAMMAAMLLAAGGAAAAAAQHDGTAAPPAALPGRIIGSPTATPPGTGTIVTPPPNGTARFADGGGGLPNPKGHDAVIGSAEGLPSAGSDRVIGAAAGGSGGSAGGVHNGDAPVPSMAMVGMSEHHHGGGSSGMILPASVESQRPDAAGEFSQPAGNGLDAQMSEHSHMQADAGGGGSSSGSNFHASHHGAVPSRAPAAFAGRARPEPEVAALYGPNLFSISSEAYGKWWTPRRR